MSKNRQALLIIAVFVSIAAVFLTKSGFLRGFLRYADYNRASLCFLATDCGQQHSGFSFEDAKASFGLISASTISANDELLPTGYNAHGSPVLNAAAEINANIEHGLTTEELAKKSHLRGGFSTYCTDSSEDRKHNIRLALDALNGCVIECGQTLSFNQMVGKRTAERGYRLSTVIINGDYALDYGGGVCQVSTTLYNSALICGLEIVERHRHTLKSSYAMPGFDAMVNSGSADLRIANTTNQPVYLLCEYVEGRITIRMYGEENPFDINRRSEVLMEERAEVEIIVDTDNVYANLLEGKSRHVLIKSIDALYSKSFLDYYLNGRLVKSVYLHSDYYYPRKGVVVLAPG
ncbi:MAG: VanW family protein [Clostridia bacterium]|nr:VanW family protein [Clostridia bacterium]